MTTTKPAPNASKNNEYSTLAQGNGRKPPSDTLKVMAAAAPDPTPPRKAKAAKKCPNGHLDLVETATGGHGNDSQMLTPAEASDLLRREAIIEDACGGSDLTRGQELLAIMRAGYHRKKGHKSSSKTIEEYAIKRFRSKIGSSHRNVQRLVSLAKAAEKIQECPDGHEIDLTREGPVRSLVEKQSKPEFKLCVAAAVAVIRGRSEEAKANGVEPKPLNGSLIQHAVNDAVSEHRDQVHQIRPQNQNQLAAGFHVSKVEDGLTFIGDGEVDLTITSFPYNCGLSYRDYGTEIWDDKVPLNVLLDFYAKWIKQIERISNPTHGRVIINIAEVYGAEYMTASGNVIYLDYEIDKIVRETTDLKPYGRIIWNKGERSLSDRHGSVASWSNPSIERQAEILLVYYRGSRQRPNEPDRKGMDNREYMELQQNLWNVNAFCGAEVHKNHPCPFPVKLAENAIKLFSAPPGPNGEFDTVCDPFGGSGSTALAAIRLGRKFVYNDASQEYARNAMQRVAKELEKIKMEKTY